MPCWFVAILGKDWKMAHGGNSAKTPMDLCSRIEFRRVLQSEGRRSIMRKQQRSRTLIAKR
jgi:hypothetical protein